MKHWHSKSPLLIFHAAAIVSSLTVGPWKAEAETNAEATSDGLQKIDIQPMPESMSARPFSVGLGLSIPDLLTLQLSHKLPFRGEITLGISPGIPYPITIVAPADEEVIKSRLKAGTPQTDYDTKIRYNRNVFINYSWQPSVERGLYFLGGLGYRKMHVTTEGEADLFVCLVTPDIPCNKETETFPSRSTIHLSADIETVSYNLRAAAAWKFEWSNHVFLDWTIIGIVYSRPKSQSITVRSRLESEQSVEEASEILQEMESYLAKKEDSIRSRVVSNVEKLDRLPLPYMGLTIGYNF